MPLSGRIRAQRVARSVALAFVVAWLFSDALQRTFPFWLPFLIVAGAEVEFLLRAWRERTALQARESPEQALERRSPGPEDADLGWVEPEDAEGDDAEGSEGESAGGEADDGVAEDVHEEPAPVLPAARDARRGRLGYVAGAAVAAVLFAVAWRVDAREAWSSVPRAERARAEALYSAEAGRIARRPVRVRCDDEYAFTGAGTDAAGVAFIERGVALLQPSVCRTLRDLALGGDAGSVDDTAWAIAVLAHEAVHLAGVRDEGATECYALQEGVALGERLGLPPADAARLMRFQLDRNAAERSLGRLPYALPAGCEDGGALDLRPDDPSFP